MRKLLYMVNVMMSGLLAASDQVHKVEVSDVQVQCGNTQEDEIHPMTRKLTGISSKAVSEVWTEFHTKTNVQESPDDQWEKFYKPKLDELGIHISEVKQGEERNSSAFVLIVQKIRDQKKIEEDLKDL